MDLSKLKLEKLTWRDLKEAKQIFDENYYENGGMLRAKTARPTLLSCGDFLLARDDEHIYGYVRIIKNYKLGSGNTIYDGCSFSKKNIYVTQEAIFKKYQGKGIGTWIMLELARKYKGYDLYCHIWDGNGLSTGMAIASGYKGIGYMFKEQFRDIKNYKAILYRMNNGKDEVESEG